MANNPIAPINCRHGIFHHYASDNAVGSHLRRFGEWAEEEILLMSLVVQEGWTALDVGANIGTHSVPLSRMVGKSGRVLAFEPQSIIFPLLMMNLCTNGAIENVTPIKGLVSDTSEARFSEAKGVTPSKGNMGSHTFVRDAKEAEFDGEYIFETSIDGLNLSRCDFIKMDIQGFERFAFAGAERTLSRLRPMIYYEQMGLTGHKEISELLARHNYTQLVHYARPYNFNNYNQFLGSGFGSNIEVNIVAVPAERTYLIDRDALAARNISLYPITDFTGSHTKTPVTSPWSMPDDAYAGTGLARYIKPRSQQAGTAWSEADVQLSVGPQWASVTIPLPDIGAFYSFEGKMSVDGDIDALNVQLLLKPDSGEHVWATLFSGKAAAGNVPLRLTRRSLDQNTLNKMNGSGSAVIRCRTADARQAEIHIRDAQLSI